MTLFHSPSVQSPKAYDLQNLQGSQLITRFTRAQLYGQLAEPHLIDADQFNFKSTNTAAQNVTALNAAIAAAQLLGGGQSTTYIQLPPGNFNLGGASDVIMVPQFVGIRGAGSRSTMLTSGSDGNTGPLFQLGGALSGVSKYGCQLSDVGIVLTNVGGEAVRFMETIGGKLFNCYIEGPINAVRTTCGVRFDGGNISTFFNEVRNVIVNHIHIGFDVMTSGTTNSTQQVITNSTVNGDVGTDTTSVGVNMRNGCGSGTVFFGGDLEACGTGALLQSGCQSSSFVGVRFEGNTTDINLQATAGATSFIGCLYDETHYTDASGATQGHQSIGCTNGSNHPNGNIFSGNMKFFGRAATDIPGRFIGAVGSGDIVSVETSGGTKLLRISPTGFGFFGSGPIAKPNITGAKGGNAALASLLSQLVAYGLITDSTT